MSNANNGILRLTSTFDVASNAIVESILIAATRFHRCRIATLPARRNTRRDRAEIYLGALMVSRVNFAPPYLMTEFSLLTTLHYWSINYTRSGDFPMSQIFGSGQYAMRLWVKALTIGRLGITVPGRFNQCGCRARTAGESCGPLGGGPIPKVTKVLPTPCRAQGRLQTPRSSLANIVIRGERRWPR